MVFCNGVSENLCYYILFGVAVDQTLKTRKVTATSLFVIAMMTKLYSKQKMF